MLKVDGEKFRRLDSVSKSEPPNQNEHIFTVKLMCYVHAVKTKQEIDRVAFEMTHL